MIFHNKTIIFLFFILSYATLFATETSLEQEIIEIQHKLNREKAAYEKTPKERVAEQLALTEEINKLKTELEEKFKEFEKPLYDNQEKLNGISNKLFTPIERYIDLSLKKLLTKNEEQQLATFTEQEKQLRIQRKALKEWVDNFRTKRNTLLKICSSLSITPSLTTQQKMLFTIITGSSIALGILYKNYKKASKAKEITSFKRYLKKIFARPLEFCKQNKVAITTIAATFLGEVYLVLKAKSTEN